MGCLPEEPPPAGGFGGGSEARRARFGRAPAPPSPKRGARHALATTLIAVVGVIALVGTLGVLFKLFMNKYMVGAKTSEARNSLGELAKDAAMAHERADGRRICPSASLPVPRDTSSIRGMRYQSAPSDWEVDKPRDAGFSCLGFSIQFPQYYQYRYEATPSAFVASARGDRNGDGRLSVFSISGEVHDAHLVVTPSIVEIDPDE